MVKTSCVYGFILVSSLLFHVSFSQSLYQSEAATSQHWVAYGGTHGCAITDSPNVGSVNCWPTGLPHTAAQTTRKYVDIFVSQPSSPSPFSCGLRDLAPVDPAIYVDCWGASIPLIQAGAYANVVGGGTGDSLTITGTGNSISIVSASGIAGQVIGGGYGDNMCMLVVGVGSIRYSGVVCFGVTSSPLITQTPVTNPGAVPAGNRYTSLAVGDGFACATRENSFNSNPPAVVVCWGAAVPAVSDVPAGEFRAVSCGATDCCAISGSARSALGAGGTLTCWGAVATGNPTWSVAGTFKTVSVGVSGGCGVTISGTTVCFGEIAQSICYEQPPTNVPLIQVVGGRSRQYGVSYTREVYRWGVASNDAIDTPVNYELAPYSSWKIWPYQDISIDQSIPNPGLCSVDASLGAFKCANVTYYFFNIAQSAYYRRQEWIRFVFVGPTYTPGAETLVFNQNVNGIFFTTKTPGIRQRMQCVLSTPCVTSIGGTSISFQDIDFEPVTAGVSSNTAAALNLVSALVTISRCSFKNFNVVPGSAAIVRITNPYANTFPVSAAVNTISQSNFTDNSVSLRVINTDASLVVDGSEFSVGTKFAPTSGSYIQSTNTQGNGRWVTILRSKFGALTGTGGVIVSGFDSVSIASNTFSSIISTGSGGAVSVTMPAAASGGSIPSFVTASNTFTACRSSSSGGAICLQHLGVVQASFIDDTYVSNVAGSYGGAICISSQHNVIGDGIINVRGGTFQSNSAAIDGGAISSAGSSSKTLTVSNSTFISNTATGSGGAIGIALGSLYVNTTVATNNVASRNGGALSVMDASPFVSTTTFRNNAASGYGGAIYTERSFQSSFATSTYVSNTATKGGGALYLLNSAEDSVVIDSNTFQQNRALAGGGGAVYWGSQGVVTEPTFTGNTFTGNIISATQGWGVNQASEPVSLVVAGNTSWTVHKQPPGQPIRPAPTFNLLDYYGNPASTGVVVQVSPPIYFSSLPATTSILGSVRFNDLRVGKNESVLPVVFTAYLTGEGLSGRTLTYSAASIDIRACVPGEYFDAGESSPGSGLFDFACRLCPTGRFGGGARDENGLPTCTDCFPGQFQNIEGSTSCPPCEIGKYTTIGGQSVCQICRGATYTDRNNTATCSDCLSNSRASTDGTRCDCLFQTYAEDESVARPNCVNCPVGAVCSYDGATAANLLAAPGYWRDVGDGSTPSAFAGIYLCPLQDACQGGLVANETANNVVSICSPGYVGPLCAACARGYYLVTNKCSRCSASAKITFPVVTVVLILFFFFMIYMGIRHRTLVRALFPWASFKILIAYAQILSVMDIVYDIPLSTFFRNFLIGPKILLLNIFEALAYRCNAENSNYYTTLLFVTLSPIIVTSVLLFFYLLVPQCVKHVSYFRNYGRKALRNTLVNVVFVLFTFCYPGISVTTLRFFKCKQIDLADGSKPWFLQADYSIECYTSKYWSYSVLALVIMALIPVGMPIFLGIYLRRKSSRLHRYNTIRRVGQLYRDYRPELYYWEVEELFRKLVMAGIVMYIASGTVNQIGAGAFLGIMFHILHAILQPFKQSAANALQHVALFAIWATLFASLALKSGALTPDSQEANAVQVLVLLVNLAVLVLGFITAFQHVTHAYKTGKHLLVAQGKDKTVMCYNDQKVLGTVRCVDCHKLYCEQCDDVIHKAPAFVNHYRKPITVEEDDDDDALSFDPKARSNSRLGRSSSKSGTSGRGRGETKGGVGMASIVPGGELETHEHVAEVFASPKSANKRDGSSSVPNNKRGSQKGATDDNNNNNNTSDEVSTPLSPPPPPAAPTLAAPLLGGGGGDRPTSPAAHIASSDSESEIASVPVRPGSLPRIPSTGALNKKAAPESPTRKLGSAPAPPSFLQQNNDAPKDNKNTAKIRDEDLNIDIGDF